jgi:hypothetical protein
MNIQRKHKGVQGQQFSKNIKLTHKRRNLTKEECIDLSISLISSQSNNPFFNPMVINRAIATIANLA